MRPKKPLIKALSLLLTAAILTSCAKVEDIPNDSADPAGTVADANAENTSSGTENGEITEELPPLPQEPYSVRLVCAGDNLIHSNIYNQASARANGEGYDFSYVYERVIPYIIDADLAILNQETLVTDAYPPSNWPMFCTPEALGDYMIDVMGFDAVSMSNNHVLDQGESGLLSSLDYWDTEHPEVVRYGAYRDEADMNDIRIKEVNGIRFAFLGYMEHTNGIVNPGTKGTKLIYLNELDLIEEQIKRADELADVVVVSPHYGIEVTNEVTESQRELTKLFAEWGADLIIGTQPHTIQECEWVEREDGTRAFVYYCLGNFVSSMDVSIAMVGGIGELEIEMDPESREISIKEPKLIPIITHYDAGFQNVRLYPYADYTAELAAAHGCGITMGLLENVIAHIPEEFLLIK